MKEILNKLSSLEGIENLKFTVVISGTKDGQIYNRECCLSDILQYCLIERLK